MRTAVDCGNHWGFLKKPKDRQSTQSNYTPHWCIPQEFYILI